MLSRKAWPSSCPHWVHFSFPAFGSNLCTHWEPSCAPKNIKLALSCGKAWILICTWTLVSPENRSVRSQKSFLLKKCCSRWRKNGPQLSTLTCRVLTSSLFPCILPHQVQRSKIMSIKFESKHSNKFVNNLNMHVATPSVCLLQRMLLPYTWHILFYRDTNFEQIKKIGLLTNI